MTVRELKYRMLYEELCDWELFEEQYGLLHQSIRAERAIAQAVAPFLKDEQGQPVKIRDLMLWPKEEEKVATLGDLADLALVFKAAAPPSKE